MTAPRVTVPVEPIQRLILAADSYGVRYLDSDDMSAEAEELQAATEAMKDLIAAPAPEGGAVDDLVDRFAAALKEKLHAAEAKYGHSDAWTRDDWRDDLVRQLNEHVQKGDPRDVAAYCAFAWHHGWSLTPRHEAPAEGAGEREEIAHEIYDFLNERFPDGALPGGVQLFADAGDHTDAGMKHEAGCDELAGRILALRARSSAPQAREDAQPVASAYRVRPEMNDPEEWTLMHPERAFDYLDRPGWETQPLYTHPAPDALRVAVEALEKIKAVRVCKESANIWTGADACRKIATEALAALQQENKP